MRTYKNWIVFATAGIALIYFSAVLPSSYAQDSTEFRRRADVLRRAVKRCEERIQSQELTNCTVAVGFDINRTVSLQEALNLAGEYDRRALRADRESETARCAAIRDRYIRDMETVKRNQKTIQMGQAELEDWTQRNEAAQQDAIKSALNLLVDGGLAYMADCTQAANGLKGAIAKYENQLKRQKKRIDPLQWGKWLEMNKRLLEMNLFISGAKALQAKKESAEIFWGYFTANAQEIDRSTNDFKNALNAVDEDPILHKILVDKALLPLVQRLKTKQLLPKKPYLLNLLEFAKDYGYSATEWVASRNRIVQQYDVSDQQLRAVQVMQEELKKTVPALNACVEKGLVIRP